jgi:hypothetical protein
MKDMPAITLQRVFTAPFQPAYTNSTRSYESLIDALDAFFKARAAIEAGLEPFRPGNLPVATARVILTVCDETGKCVESYKKTLPARDKISRAISEWEAKQE